MSRTRTDPIRPIEERLWGRTEQDGDCMIWQGVKLPSGYGQIKVGSMADGSRRSAYAHRVSWELANDAEIPDGRQIHHTCGRRDCINPAHLELVDDNSAHGAIHQAQRTHCRRGHERVPDNQVWYRSSANGRMYPQCKQCRALAEDRRREKEAAWRG